MRTIRISSEVWEAIADRGKFGETPDDVLRRVFSLAHPAKREKQKLAKYKMFVRVRDGQLRVKFKNGPSDAFPLPPHDDKASLQTMRDSAVDFLKQNGATKDQQATLKNALTKAGYHIAH